MICTTIQNKTIDEILGILESGTVEMAEIRLDRCPLSMEDIEELFSTSDVPLVATCRISEVRKRIVAANPDMDDRKIDTRAVQEAESELITAIHSGAAFVDLEIEAPAMMSKRLRRETRENGTVYVRSYHDYNGTDSAEALKALTEKCFAIGADIAKIVTTAQGDDDQVNASVTRLLSLYDTFDPAKLIAFAMGEQGRDSRIQCLAKGAPYTYAALNQSEAAAPGQMTTARMKQLVYGNRLPSMPADRDIIQMPSSKSFAQRAIIAAALAEGTTTLKGYSPCGDNESAISVARSLGADITVGLSYEKGQVTKDTSALTIKGIGAKAGGLALTRLETGESGLLTRLMIPLVAALGGGETEIAGEGTLTRRPLKGAREIMASFGVSLETFRRKKRCSEALKKFSCR